MSLRIRTFFTRMLLALFMVGGVMAASITQARADVFAVCPSGTSGVATNVTSCPFADEVRYAWQIHGGTSFFAFSPVTQRSYLMNCSAGVAIALDNGANRIGYQCYGGNNAEVVFW